jgi:rod shape-determining protein MreC
MPRRELLRQIEQLRRQNQDLGLRLEQEGQVWSENARLRAEAGWARQSPWRVKLGRVIAREPANWWRSLEIDLGARDGLRANLPVLTTEGALAGRVSSVGETRSQVILLGDPSVRVAAVVATGGTNRETGVITANTSAPQDEGMIDLDYLSGNSAVRPGQPVVTWGVGGVFPAGITIGKIVDTRARENGLTIEARVKLAANLGALEEVWVILP